MDSERVCLMHRAMIEVVDRGHNKKRIDRRWSSISMPTSCALTSLLLLSLCVPTYSMPPSRKAKGGCHLFGFEKSISLPGCDEVNVVINACRGQCLSWSIPSLLSNTIESHSSCCRIQTFEQLSFTFDCADGPRTLSIDSAASCHCFDCAVDYEQ